MAVYAEIITWSNNKAEFIKDALRRLIQSPSITNTDIDDLTDLLKKEVGFTGITKVAVPINTSHIPSTFSNIGDVANIVSIENPVNINALYNQAKIEFKNTGLTVVYGNNGSGKSGYAKILKKICWSRHKNFQLKTNVYTNDTTPQSVSVKYEFAGSPNTYIWNNSQTPNPHLNSIFVFDNECANIYLNAENITEYKPLGIDLLERLITVFSEIEAKINLEKSILITQKPLLNPAKFSNSQIYNWYLGIEQINTSVILTIIQFTQINIDRKSELISLLNSVNPVKQKLSLEQKKARFQATVIDLQNNLKLFSSAALISITESKEDYIVKHDAYLLAQQNLTGVFPLSGVGSESWRLLWEAAKEYAIIEVHPESPNFPSDKSEEFCIFCQQQIQDDAKERIHKFNLFITDKTSSEFETAKQKLQKLTDGILKLTLTLTNTIDELDADIPNFKINYEKQIEEFEAAKKIVLQYLQTDHKEVLSPLSNKVDIISIIQIEIAKIDQTILNLNSVINSRDALESELLELEGLEFLENNKSQIITYHQEYAIKSNLDKCLTYINTTTVSRKIGELLETEAIALQQQEFLAHLTSLNRDIANKISIKKTKTANGKTFQKCSFNSINESINTIFSEGELKVVALANFLSECTIDNRRNSIIFDDPVSSLDQDYREAIAKILVNLSSNRQVIVLTHDLYFLRLLLEFHDNIFGNDCKILGLSQNSGICGYESDEIPYLSKNTQQRIDSIRAILNQIQALSPTNQAQIEILLDSARKRFRMLIEKAVEEVLANKSIERFSRNIHVKGGYLSSFVVAELSDIQLLLSLFGKYSITEHDGSTSSLPQLPDKSEIDLDLTSFGNWKNAFNVKLRAFKTANGYQ